jgi:hypothetical protein
MGVVAERPECRRQGRRRKEASQNVCYVAARFADINLKEVLVVSRGSAIGHCQTRAVQHTSGFVAFNEYAFLPKLGRNCAALSTRKKMTIATERSSRPCQIRESGLRRFSFRADSRAFRNPPKGELGSGKSIHTDSSQESEGSGVPLQQACVGETDP